MKFHAIWDAVLKQPEADDAERWIYISYASVTAHRTSRFVRRDKSTNSDRGYKESQRFVQQRQGCSQLYIGRGAD